MVLIIQFGKTDALSYRFTCEPIAQGDSDQSSKGLHHSGKPYHVVVFTIHKLIALGAVAFLTVLVYQTKQTTPLSSAQIAAGAVAAACFVALIITGGLLSVEKNMPLFVLKIHQILPYLSLLSIGMTFYLLFIRNSLISPA